MTITNLPVEHRDLIEALTTGDWLAACKLHDFSVIRPTRREAAARLHDHKVNWNCAPLTQDEEPATTSADDAYDVVEVGATQRVVSLRDRVFAALECTTQSATYDEMTDSVMVEIDNAIDEFSPILSGVAELLDLVPSCLEAARYRNDRRTGTERDQRARLFALVGELSHLLDGLTER